MLKLFISKSESETEELLHFCEEKNISLTAQSLIYFEPVDFEVKEPFEILFFSSPRSVMFYLRLISISPNTIIASVGSSTGNLLRELGHPPAFEGEGSDPDSIAAEFEQFAAGKRVLFPLAEKSLRSISGRFSEAQIEEVKVYRTCPKETEIASQDIYVFTSPSNVEAFFSINTVPEGAQIISWGKSTATAIKKKGLISKMLSEPGISSLIEFLDSII